MVTHHIHCFMDYIVYVDIQIDFHYKKTFFVQVAWWTNGNTVDN